MKIKCTDCGENRTFGGEKGMEERLKRENTTLEKFKEKYVCKHCAKKREDGEKKVKK